MSWISKADALDEARKRFPHLALDEKILLNWAKEGGECPPAKKGTRIGFNPAALHEWVHRIESSLVELNDDEYLQCLDFAIEAYYARITKADFGRVKQRDVGEFLTNQIQGKLGEIALQKLLLKHGLAVELDFKVTGQLPSQDIAKISTRKRKDVWDNPAVKVSIKATKFKNFLLAVAENEATLPDRKSDIYVLSQVGLFPNHILRLLKKHEDEAVRKSSELIPDFAPIPARIAGWASHAKLTAKPALSGDRIEQEYGIRMASLNFVLRSGELSADWVRLKDIIVSGFERH